MLTRASICDSAESVTASTSVWLYPQTDVFKDLVEARAADGADVRFGVTEPAVADLMTDRPAMQFTDADGIRYEIRCDFLVGADGSRSMCRRQLPESQRRQVAKEYPFAWFGIITEAPRSVAHAAGRE